MTSNIDLSTLHSATDSTTGRRLQRELQQYVKPGDGMMVQNPMSSLEGDNIPMTAKQWLSTFDAQYKKNNPEEAAINAYYNPSQSSRGFGYALGDILNKQYHKLKGPVGYVLNKGPVAGGLLTAVPGLLAGGLGTGVLNLLLNRPLGSDVLRNALLGGLTTGAAGAYSGYIRKNKPEYADAQHPRNLNDDTKRRLHDMARSMAMQAVKSSSIKSAFASAADAQSQIVKAIQSSPALSFQEKSQLIAGVAQLSSPDLSRLATSLSGYGGAAVGAIVAKFLLNKGLIGTVLGAIFGGNLARNVFGNVAPRNDLGRPSFQGKSITGQSI